MNFVISDLMNNLGALKDKHTFPTVCATSISVMESFTEDVTRQITVMVFAHAMEPYIIENIFHQIDHCAVPTRPPRLMSHPSVGQPSMKPFWYMISHIRLQEPAGPTTIQRRERCPKSRRGIEKNQTQMEAAPMTSTR